VVLMCEADAFIENRARCLEAGMQDVVTKPLNKGDLIRAVEDVYK
jgi:CheY-like chemotaxis protein